MPNIDHKTYKSSLAKDNFKEIQKALKKFHYLDQNGLLTEQFYKVFVPTFIDKCMTINAHPVPKNIFTFLVDEIVQHCRLSPQNPPPLSIEQCLEGVRQFLIKDQMDYALVWAEALMRPYGLLQEKPLILDREAAQGFFTIACYFREMSFMEPYQDIFKQFIDLSQKTLGKGKMKQMLQELELYTQEAKNSDLIDLRDTIAEIKKNLRPQAAPEDASPQPQVMKQMPQPIRALPPIDQWFGEAHGYKSTLNPESIQQKNVVESYGRAVKAVYQILNFIHAASKILADKTSGLTDKNLLFQARLMKCMADLDPHAQPESFKLDEPFENSSAIHDTYKRLDEVWEKLYDDFEAYTQKTLDILKQLSSSHRPLLRLMAKNIERQSTALLNDLEPNNLPQSFQKIMEEAGCAVPFVNIDEYTARKLARVSPAAGHQESLSASVGKFVV